MSEGELEFLSDAVEGQPDIIVDQEKTADMTTFLPHLSAADTLGISLDGRPEPGRRPSFVRFGTGESNDTISPLPLAPMRPIRGSPRSLTERGKSQWTPPAEWSFGEEEVKEYTEQNRSRQLRKSQSLT